MLVWGKETFIVHNTKEIVTQMEGVDIIVFKQEQEKAQKKYKEIASKLGYKVNKYGVQGEEVIISVNQGKMYIATEKGKTVPTKVKEVVAEENKKQTHRNIRKESIKEIMKLIKERITSEYVEETEEVLRGIVYKNDVDLLNQLVKIMNTWLLEDEIKGIVHYTNEGLQVDFNLEHNITVFIHDYGKPDSEKEYKFFVVLLNDDTIEDKVWKMVKVLLDYYYWLDPFDLTYNTNKTIGDKNIKVTMRDRRIVSYQDRVNKIIRDVAENNRHVRTVEINNSHSTRSVYATVTFIDDCPSIRFSVRDHSKILEEGIEIIRVNTLKSTNIAKRVEKLINTHRQETEQKKGKEEVEKIGT